jgi:hypothetical protein
METTTVASWIHSLPPEDAMRVIWLWRQSLPPLPLELWLHIVSFTQGRDRLHLLQGVQPLWNYCQTKLSARSLLSPWLEFTPYGTTTYISLFGKKLGWIDRPCQEWRLVVNEKVMLSFPHSCEWVAVQQGQLAIRFTYRPYRWSPTNVHIEDAHFLAHSVHKAGPIDWTQAIVTFLRRVAPVFNVFQ